MTRTEYRHPFSVTIQGLGKVQVTAVDAWTAVCQAYALYNHREPNKDMYKAKRIRYKYYRSQ